MRALLAERRCLVVLEYARDEGQQSSWPGLVPLDTTEQGRAWLESEASAWLATLRGAAARGEHARVAATAEAMEGFAHVCAFSGYWAEVYHSSPTGRACASSAAPRSPWPCTSASSPFWTRPTAG
ncbi:hypothetical protein ACIRU5_28420 [Streptomyces misionensis]|uniref:hypothetical protein n=1 Tax=Streptomyces misionensis TaxID=67331 RepID=UPI00383013A3